MMRKGDDQANRNVNSSSCSWVFSVFVILAIFLICEWFVTFGEFPGLPNFRPAKEAQEWIDAEESRESPPNDDNPKDDPSCRSRTQHLFMRNASSIFNLPPQLSQVLLAHEEMQARCSYRKNLKQTISSPDPSDNCKYLVFLNNEGYVGLGNHILSLVSAFLYALLTNRMLLMDTRGNLSKLLCEPFPNSSWLLPPDFPYDRIHQAPPLGDALRQDFRFGNVVHLMLSYEQSLGDQQFFCEETQSRLENITWIGWTSSQYYIPRLFAHPSFWKRLVAWFPDSSLVFTHLSRYMLLPRNEIWGRIQRTYSSYLSSSPTSIPATKVGLQIRLHHTKDPAAFDVGANERIMQCLIGNDILPNTSSQRDEVSASTGKVNKVFIASLQIRFYEEMKKKYIEFPTMDGSLVQIHTLSHDGVQSASLDQAVDAFVEMWLLSFSDVIVTSSWSTFGYVAQGLGALRPHILNIRGENLAGKEILPPCFLSQSIEPCNHFPFLSPPCKKNQTSYMEHNSWISQHIRHCQDESRGIQLV